MDSGAFTQVALRGGYDQTPQAYAALVRRYAGTGLVGATTQDWMTEDLALQATGLTAKRHPALTIERYDAVRDAGTSGVYLIPVLQGRTPDDYRRHLDAYGGRIGQGAWVGVGSVCKRQGDPSTIAAILQAILADRADLRLHGFGCKTTSLFDDRARARLATADSMAWSFAAGSRGPGSEQLAEGGPLRPQRRRLPGGGCASVSPGRLAKDRRLIGRDHVA